jgi:hypothetical protein
LPNPQQVEATEKALHFGHELVRVVDELASPPAAAIRSRRRKADEMGARAGFVQPTPADAWPFIRSGNPVDAGVLAQQKRRMPDGAGGGEWRWAELVQLSEGVVWNDERSSFESPLQAKAKRHRERTTIIATDATREPVRFRLVQVGDVHNRVVHQATSHPTRRIRVALDLRQPSRRIGGRIDRPEVRDEVGEARMVNSEQNRSILVFDEAFDVAIHRHHDAAIVKHP